MAIFKEFSPEDVKTSKSFLNQLVDIINTDISSSTTRRKYQVFVTGGLGPGVTSSLFQTVYDQDFSLQTANPIFDVTVGLHTGSVAVVSTNPTIDSNGKYLFGSNYLMMREKLDIYRLFASELLGSSTERFTANVGSSQIQLDHPMFICFKRLFARDQIKRETFAIKTSPSATVATYPAPNLAIPGSASIKIYTDVNSSANKEFTFGGQVGTVVDSANTSHAVGMLFIDKGVLVLDISRSFSMEQGLSGTIRGVVSGGINYNFSGTMNDLLTSASIDDICDHLCSTRFTGSDVTSMTFQNITNINSSLFFCRTTADEHNYSSNPSYLDSSNRIVVIDEGQEESQKSFTFITSVGLYDAFDNLLAVAKVSRPILKDNERDLTLKIRLDY
jgi:hypothetical protein